RAKFAENVSAEELLRDPRELIKPAVAGIGDPGGIASADGKNSTSLNIAPADVYRNSPLVNFAYKDSQEKMQGTLLEVRKRFGEKYPLVIGGEKIWTDQLTPSVNPSATNCPRSKSSRSANRGMKPMETFARPSISAGSMRSRCDVSDVRSSHNVFPERIAIITTGRAASHLSLHHGIFRSRFFAEWHLPEL